MSSRDLFYTSAVRSDAEKVPGAPDSGNEVDVLTVWRPHRTTRVEVPVFSEVQRLTTIGWSDIQVSWPAMLQLSIDDHVGTEGARIRDPSAIR